MRQSHQRQVDQPNHLHKTGSRRPAHDRGPLCTDAFDLLFEHITNLREEVEDLRSQVAELRHKCPGVAA
jgi:hypothetical protein